MQTQYPTNRLERLSAWLTARDGRRSLRILTAAWAAFSVLQFTIWAAVCAGTGDLQSPWWVWPVMPTGLAIAAAWLLAPGAESADAKSVDLIAAQGD